MANLNLYSLQGHLLYVADGEEFPNTLSELKEKLN